MRFSGFFCLVAICFASANSNGQAACFDSIHTTVTPVQCYSFRNGMIAMDSVYGGQSPFYYALDGTTFSTRPVFDRLWPGDYVVYIRDAQGCEQSLPITVSEPPKLEVTLTASKNSVKRGEPFNLTATVSPLDADIASIDWRPPSYFDRTDTYSQTVQISETTTFAIEVVQKDGCTARAQVVVEADLANLYFPNVIEMGSNENAYFTVFAGEGVSKVKMLRIYSRDGGNVFERFDFQPNSPLLGWGGFWNGKRLQPAVFTWVAVIEYADLSLEQFGGTVTLLR